MNFRNILLLTVFLVPSSVLAQYDWQDQTEVKKMYLRDNLNYKMEMQGSYSSHQTPLWLNANKYGLSSLDRTNGYLRLGAIRPLHTDSARRWGVGYGVDLVVPSHYTSHFVVQQAFIEGRWLNGVLTIGSKEYPMELKSNTLSSGSQTLGINARPVPQVRLSLPEYWTIPILGRWFHLKGHIAYGMFTDDNWQQDVTQKQTRYTRHALYHSKAGYLMIGSPERFCPWSLELGLEMAAEFGGTSYQPNSEGIMVGTRSGHSLVDFWRAFIPSGQDASDGEYGNIEGNQLGSWLARLNYDAETYTVSFYADHFFEDHSQIFLLDYDGYGSGDEWNVKKHNRFFMYALKDIMLGGELKLKYGSWLRGLVIEYLNTKYQSGPYNHDRTSGISDHVAGQDDYYNHGNYTGWQHWGQVMGNPLFRSPLYNTDGIIRVEDNRFKAFHLGVEGQPSENITYRILASYQEGFGTYNDPYTKKRHNVSTSVEATYHFPHHWNVKGAYGMDFGSILGHTAGFQLTVTKTGVFHL